MSLNTIVGLAEIRSKLNCSQAEMGRLLRITANKVSQIENSRREIQTKEFKILVCIRVNVNNFLKEQEIPFELPTADNSLIQSKIDSRIPILKAELLKAQAAVDKTEREMVLAIKSLPDYAYQLANTKEFEVLTIRWLQEMQKHQLKKISAESQLALHQLKLKIHLIKQEMVFLEGIVAGI